MSTFTTLYIVDDHKIVIDGIQSFLIGNNHYKLIGSAISSRKLFVDLESVQPDILLLDINLPNMSGIQIAQTITRQYPQIKIVFLTSDIDKKSFDDAIQTGAVGYFTKDITEIEFFEGLDKITDGSPYFSKGIQPVLFESYSNKVNATNNNILSPREIEITQLFSEGLSFKEIADKLSISPRTVETHKKNILEKLDLKNTIELVRYALRNGLTSL
jgi:two-component system response regulator NreC